jgi:peptidoglycan-associated lipoprotein
MTTKPYRLFAAAGIAALVAACASTPLDENKPAPVADKSASAPAPAPAPDTRTVAKVDSMAGQPLDPLMDPKSALAKRSIFFDFDRFEIRQEFTPTVEAHGRYLASNRGKRVVVEGNADERGSREYNLALGQKRAEAVKSRLLLLGATDTQVDTVSFGEERPKSGGHDESAWAENRRADLVYK